MVTQGQFLERPTLIPVGERVLEGLSHRGQKRPLLLVLPPLPDEGGGMDHVIGAELAFAVTQAGFPTLRFNYRGVGGSHGPRDGSDAAVREDIEAALVVARENIEDGDVVLASVEGSATHAIAVAQAHPKLIRGVLVLNPPQHFPPPTTEPLPERLWVAVAEHDTRVSRPALQEALRLGFQGASSPPNPTGGRLEIIAGADRSFQRGLPQLGRLAVGLLTEAAAAAEH